MRTIFTKIKEYQEPVFIFFLTRIFLFTVAAFGISRFPMHGKEGFWQAFPFNPFLDGWIRWDAGWYANIALEGYKYIPGQQSNVAFFPLYPILIKILNLFINNVYISGLIISNLSFFFALILLYKLVKQKFDESNAQRTILYIAIFPASLFFAAMYTESLFLLTAVASFYFAEKKNWLGAGICGFLSSMTRLVGIILFLAIIIKYLEDIEFNFKNIRWDIIFIGLIPLGLITFMAILNFQVGNPLSFIKVEDVSGWERHLALPWTTIIHEFQRGTWVNLILTFLFLGLSIGVFQRLGFSYGTFAIFLIIIPIMSGILEGMGRFTSVIFPIFMFMADLGKNKFIDKTITYGSLMLLSALTIMFVNYLWK